MTNQKAPEQGGVTEEQIEAAARALACLEPGEDWPTNGELGGSPTGTRDDEYRDGMRDTARDALEAAAAVSASVSADPAGEHHDAEEREAQSEDHAATVTDDRDKRSLLANILDARFGGAFSAVAWRVNPEYREATIDAVLEAVERGEGR